MQYIFEIAKLLCITSLHWYFLYSFWELMVEKFDRVLVKEVTVDGHLISFRLHFFFTSIWFSVYSF